MKENLFTSSNNGKKTWTEAHFNNTESTDI